MIEDGEPQEAIFQRIAVISVGLWWLRKPFFLFESFGGRVSLMPVASVFKEFFVTQLARK
jgi:hypothetical protein